MQDVGRIHHNQRNKCRSIREIAYANVSYIRANSVVRRVRFEYNSQENEKKNEPCIVEVAPIGVGRNNIEERKLDKTI